MDYELYHDESKESGYWHGIFLVPTSSKEVVIKFLKSARENTGYSDPIGIKCVKEKKSKIYALASAWINIAVASLIQNFRGKSYYSFFGKIEKAKQVPEQFNEIVKCKFILFRETDNHSKMTNHKDYGSKVETTFRMGMKGGIHFLGNIDEPINITKMHFDGYEHYQRKIDKDRIVKRLGDLKDFCSIADKDDLIDDRTSNHNNKDSQEYEDCQLLQLTDLLVGGFRTHLGECTRDIHQNLNHPIKLLIDAYFEGYARMKNSRWFNGFCLSQCSLEKDRWVFEELSYSKKDETEQLTLELK